MARWQPLRERLLSRLIIDPSGCVLWTGTTDSDGYGRIWVDGRDQLVHRVMYSLFVGLIPDGLQVDHLCRVRHCANVAHLEPVTQRINILRGVGAGARNAVKTHCKNGHEFDLLNTRWLPNGWRNCRACNREAVRCYKARRQVTP